MTEAPPAPPRNPLGWIGLALLFAFLIFKADQRPKSDTPQARVERYTSRLETALSVYAAGDNPFSQALSGKAPDQSLRELERDLEPRHRTDAIDSGFWAVTRKHLGEPVTEADLGPLKKDPNDAILAEANRTVKRTPDEAMSLVSKLERRGAASRLAAEHVRKEAGLSLPVPHSRAFKNILAGFLVLGLLVGCGLAWVFAAATFATEAIHWPGPAIRPETLGEADELSLRAATLMVAFLALGIIMGLFVTAGFDARMGQIFLYGAMLVVVPLTLRRRPSMATVGFSTRDFARNVGLGLWFFLLEIPVTLGIALICAALLKNLPQPEHPASTALMNSPDLLTIVVTFFGGAIVAPFWEEAMFRGLLFPALRRVMNSPILAAIVSSFLFASIHPQGPVLWASLATVALFSCFLAQKSGSLVPSVAMHLAHNSALLALTVLISKG